MRLTKLIAGGEAALEGEDRDITGLTADSRKVEAGYLFAAIPGTAHDGRNFITEALRRGAAAILVADDEDSSRGAPPLLASPSRGEEHHRCAGESNSQRARSDSPPLEGGVGGGGVKPGSNSPVSIITARDIRKAISAIAANFYPRQPETIAAVTGTSGKTSSAQFAREIWQALGHKSASLGTLGLVTARETRYGSLTTPDAITLHGLLDEVAGAGITHLALEASSHGLAMHRLDHAHIKAAAFTNLSRDHLDFHGTMEEYLAAKLRLFIQVLPQNGVAVLNADAPEFAEFARAAGARQIIGYGTKGKELRLIESKPDAKGQLLRMEIFGKPKDILLPVIGRFQAWNGLCALGLVLGCGEDADRAAAALGKVSGVPGRLELAGHTKNGAAVFVDYAHKPDALENVLTAIRPHVAAHKGAKLGVVFGCGGNRDKGKRPMMGAIAQRLADWVIVTDDNPRHEDPATIRREILTASPGAREIGDRGAAIAAGIGQLQNGDVLIIAGKGHESGQIVGDKTLPFDDAAVARRALGT